MAKRGREAMAKRARERARLEKKEAKREKRESRAAEDEQALSETDETALMEEFARLSERLQAEEISQADFEQERERIFSELGIDTD